MPKCGAKTRRGSPCQRAPVPGKRRCKLHGGMSTGPKDARGNKNGAKPGSLYSKFFTDEELDLVNEIELGKVDEELVLCRVRLHRALKAEKESDNLPVLEEHTTRQGGGPNTVGYEETHRRKDYAALIDKLTARIAKLELTRLALILRTPEDDEVVQPVKITVNVIDASKTDAEPEP